MKLYRCALRENEQSPIISEGWRFVTSTQVDGMYLSDTLLNDVKLCRSLRAIFDTSGVKLLNGYFKDFGEDGLKIVRSDTRSSAEQRGILVLLKLRLPDSKVTISFSNPKQWILYGEVDKRSLPVRSEIFILNRGDSFDVIIDDIPTHRLTCNNSDELVYEDIKPSFLNRLQFRVVGFFKKNRNIRPLREIHMVD